MLCSTEETIRKIKGRIVCALKGQKTEYEDASLIPESFFAKEMEIKSIAGDGEKIVVCLAYSDIRKNDLNEDWVKDYIKENGKEPGFF